MSNATVRVTCPVGSLLLSRKTPQWRRAVGAQSVITPACGLEGARSPTAQAFGKPLVSLRPDTDGRHHRCFSQRLECYSSDHRGNEPQSHAGFFLPSNNINAVDGIRRDVAYLKTNARKRIHAWKGDAHAVQPGAEVRHVGRSQTNCVRAISSSFTGVKLRSRIASMRASASLGIQRC